ncbi:two-component system sporulation sensor kinase A [Pullulanibacillus pueri]|uniref:histidine kinase n=1 Tax=Pullulanibacillus pueri TaxID=1437324 RepID=A0A8J3ELT9_9BACL|nr:PAS domain-containing sensor histidine kinase [Pullulanibacillus pueri]MBM7682337.1 two-component system sporulation sensor kinase A [Pullulanibacillus pueri]GGH80746.1 sporulation kinase A [Pullulanibacillus pueri]
MDRVDKLNPNAAKEHTLENSQLYHQYFSEMVSRHYLSSGEFIYISPSFHKLIHYSPYDLYGQSFYSLIHPQDRERVTEQFRSQQANGKMSYRLKRKVGDYIWVETEYSKNVTEPKDNEDTLCFCITRDVTEYKRVEEELKEQEDKYRTLVEQSHDTIGIMSEEGYWIYINESGKRLLGITQASEAIGRSIFSFVDHSQTNLLKREFSKIKETWEPLKLNNITIIRTDNETRETEIDIIPTSYKERRTLQVVITDITEQRKTEDFLQQTEKLSVIGHLAAGIAHEIRNPLTTIKGFVQLLKGKMEAKYSRVMMQELERIETIVGDLLVLAKPEVVSKETVDLVELMNRTVTLLQSQAILNNVSIEFKPESEEVPIKCEPNKLKQVFINILKNAIEALPNGGDIRVTQSFNRDQSILLSFSDDGNGIPKERLARLGEPFYSTKEKGTGLGLMICDRIIKSHGGSMEIDSVVGKGTTIKVKLPIDSDE